MSNEKPDNPGPPDAEDIYGENAEPPPPNVMPQSDEGLVTPGKPPMTHETDPDAKQDPQR
ncbi:MAG: hypothetical protein ACOCZK_08220 [Planctomycetota bacterium]